MFRNVWHALLLACAIHISTWLYTAPQLKV
jgi:hypothetical protein